MFQRKLLSPFPRQMQQVPPKHWYSFTKPHDITSQEVIIFILLVSPLHESWLAEDKEGLYS
jgi:hypothetical protein